MPKPDDKNRVYRPILCLACGAKIGEEHVFRGRLRLPCPACGRVMVMIFRQRKAGGSDSARSGSPTGN